MKVLLSLSGFLQESFYNMGKKILLVERDELLRSSLSQKLIQEGYEVAEVSDAGEGFRMMHEKKPQAVVWDLGMPRGMELLEEKNRDALLRAIPLIAIVHPGQEWELELAKELGISLFVEPNELSLQELVEKIKQAIGPPYSS